MVCIPLVEDKTKMNDAIKQQVDLGATLLYSHGGVTDSFMMNGGSIDVIAQMVDLIKAQGVPAGVGGHSLNMPMACEKDKVNNDFYVKTFHMDRYWSATPQEQRKEYDWMRGNASDHNAQQRQHVVQQPRGDGGLHGNGREALGGVQGDGRRGDLAARWPSPTPIATAPTSSSPGCSTSRSRTTSRSPSNASQKLGQPQAALARLRSHAPACDHAHPRDHCLRHGTGALPQDLLP